MDDDATLDDFAADPDGEPFDGDASDTSGGDDTNADVDTADTADTDTNPDADADPAVSTSTWTTGGAACDRCGAVVERRWVDGEETVCADCTAW